MFAKFVRKIFFRTLVIILLLSGVFVLMGHRSWARGVALGGAASLVNFLAMAGHIPRHAVKVGPGGQRSAAGRYALRMVIAGAVLFAAASMDRIALWAAIPALFIAQAVLIVGELTGGTDRKNEMETR
ncbi:MAG: ATP synthase subunit I [Deltaproteobacteria bacterium]|nr:ATP synthase subunit I [Deltaproteobacteria bacterium]